MRASQKSNRNRGKNNRNKSMGNVTNRVFESNGPEGKVRGTPQQIIDKYEQLARDAQTSGDRVVAENFLQHAEHYARLLSAAQAEMQARQGGDQPDAQGGQQNRNDGQGHAQGGGQGGGQNNANSGGQRGDRNDRNDGQQSGQRHDGQPARAQQRDLSEQPQPDAPMGGFNGKVEAGGGSQGDVLGAIDPSEQEQPELVLTPESGDDAPRPSRRRRAPRRAEPRGDEKREASGEGEGDAPQKASGEAGEDAPAPKPRRRAPRAKQGDAAESAPAPAPAESGADS